METSETLFERECRRYHEYCQFYGSVLSPETYKILVESNEEFARMQYNTYHNLMHPIYSVIYVGCYIYALPPCHEEDKPPGYRAPVF